jgi:hypothetical protein
LPLHFHLLQGLSLLLPSSHLPLFASLLSLLGDLAFLTPSILLLSLSQHLHLHPTFRLSLLSLSLLATTALQLPLPTVLTVSLLLISFYFLLAGDTVEVSTLLFCLAIGLQQGMVWFVPAYAVIVSH